MDSFKLKVFAITVMLIDHVGVVLVYPTNHYWLYLACRAIGRLAFPIFAFLIVEGLRHSRDVKKYLKRLLAFALISEIPFDLAFYKFDFNINAISDLKRLFRDPVHANDVFHRIFLHQNVFFTLFLGLLLIYLFELVERKYSKNDFMSLVINNLIDGLLTVAICAIAIFLRTDYDIAGILIIVAFYLFHDSKALMTISVLMISATLLCNFTQFKQFGNWLSIVSILEPLAIIPIALYNGKKGKSMRYLFYAFYPVHLLCLFLVASILML
jgi:hypothetical protein